MRLEMLGRFRIVGDQGEIPLGAAKQVALLAYLACAGPEPQPRGRLLELLWGSRFETQARQSLRQALAQIRRTFGTDVILADGPAFRLDEGVTVDRAEIARLAAEASLPALEQAVALWRGELLDGFTLAEPSFVEWLESERRRVRDVAVDAMRRLAENRLANGDPATALSEARRAIALEPLRDDLRRIVLRCLAALGRRAEALRCHEDYCRLLKAELGAEADPETEALVATLRRSASPAAQHVEPSPTMPVQAPDRSSPEMPPADRRPHLPLPSLAIAPLAALTTDGETRLAARAFAEDLEIAFSRLTTLRVSARAEESTAGAGADYRLEGSVRPRRGGTRINVQLIDAASALTLWAAGYDTSRDDFLDGAEDVIDALTATAQTQIVLHEGSRGGQSAEALAAHAWLEIYRLTPESIGRAGELAQAAIAAAPDHHRGHQALACVRHHEFYMGFAADPVRARDDGLAHVRRALELKEDDEYSYWILGNLHMDRSETEAALAAFGRSSEINPSFSLARASRGTALAWAGRSAEAIAVSEVALAANPNDPSNFFRQNSIAVAHFAAGGFAEAVRFAELVIQRKPKVHVPHLIRIAALHHLGDTAGASAAASALKTSFPDFQIDDTRHLPLVRAGDQERLFEGIRPYLGAAPGSEAPPT